MKETKYHTFVVDKKGNKKGTGKASIPKHESKRTKEVKK